MPLPPLYKYLDVQGARFTLRNRTFKHSKPSDFNDTEDLTIQSIFPEETEVALKKLEAGFVDVILQHLSDPPTCKPPMREKLSLLQHIYRNDPKAADVVKAEMRKKPIFDVEHMRARAKEFIKEINELMQGYRVLCVTTHKNSEKMWSLYAERHKGVVLRIEPNLAKDSKFQLFKPVRYRATRPPLYADTLEFIAGALFGDHEKRREEAIETIIYTKTLEWEYESEYRLAIPMRQNEKPWDTLRYHPEEITELYLGVAMEQADIDDIVGMARAANPNMVIFADEPTERSGF